MKVSVKITCHILRKNIRLATSYKSYIENQFSVLPGSYTCESFMRPDLLAIIKENEIQKKTRTPIKFHKKNRNI